jgi:cytochrome P450
VLSRYDDVVAVSSDPATFCSGRGILIEEIGRTYDTPPTMMHTDPPEHARYRKRVLPGFRPAVIRGLEPLVRSRAKALVDALPIGEPVDVVAHLAVPFPLQVIAALLGLPEDDIDRLFEWSEAAIPGATDLSDERRMELMGELTVYLLELAAARRESPRDDVVSELASVAADDEALRDDELAMFLIQLVVAGNETTRNALSGGLLALAEHPDQWSRLRDDPSVLSPAIEEILRWTSPVVSFMRTATRDTVVRDVAVTAGDPLLMLYASANRDEATFGPTASEFDISRDPNHHVALGFGIHFCLGAALARLELRVVLDELLARARTLDRVGDVVRSGSSIIAGVRQAPLTLGR